MQSVRSCILLFLAGLVALAGEPEALPHLLPVPKECRRTGGDIPLSASLCIALGSKATEPERYAAEMLQKHIQKRFERAVPIHAEDSIPEGVQQVVLLGQAGTNAWLARLLREKNIEQEPRSESRDDFLIEVVSDGARQVVLLAGASARAVTYAQDAFHQLLTRQDGQVVFPAVSLRDWPSIAWRGRIAAQHSWHVGPGVMDSYTRARFNLIDLRQSDRRNDRATYSGIRPDAQLDMEQTRLVIAEAHRRGILVYGVVWCGVPPGQHGQAVTMFERLLDEGVDGVWVSFDDGGKGGAPAAVVERVLDMLKQRGLPLDRVATTPMMGSYEWVDTETNRELAKVGDFGKVRWFFTAVPGAGGAQDAQKIGLTRKPSWWYNWPRTRGGFLYAGGALYSMRSDSKPVYIPLCRVHEGWGNPTDARLAKMAAHVDAVLYNGLGFADYLPQVFGIWAWEPERHDWSRTRDTVYEYVFGPAHAADARAFDDGLLELMGFFNLPIGRTVAGENWPPTLQVEGMRDMVDEQVAVLEAVAERLTKGAPATTLIDPARLESEILEPMRATLRVARTLAKVDFFEYREMSLAFEVEGLVRKEKKAEAVQLLAEAQARIPALREQLEEGLAGLRGIKEYCDAWNKKLSATGHFVQFAEQQRRFQKQLFVAFQSLKLGEAMDGVAKPPAGEVVAEVRPESWLEGPLLKSGDVRMGILGGEAKTAVGVGYLYGTGYSAYNYGEVQTSVAVPAVEGPVALDVFAGSVTTGTGRVPGARTAELWIGDRLAWQQDVVDLAEGSQWHGIDITEDVRNGATLRLRFRVTNGRPTSKYRALTFLGPVRVRRGAVAKAVPAPGSAPRSPGDPPPAAPTPTPPRPAGAGRVPAPPAPPSSPPKAAPRVAAARPARPSVVSRSGNAPDTPVVIRRVPVAGNEPPNVPLYVFLGLSLALNAHLAWRLFQRRPGASS